MIPGFDRLICARHLMKRDESKLSELISKTEGNICDKKHSCSEILKDIYGYKGGNYYEYGLVESINPEDFNAKLQSLQDRWDSLCPGFFI